MSFHIEWESPDEGDFCLFSSDREEPLHCWQMAATGETTNERTIDETIAFWMTQTDEALRLAEVEVEVLHLESDDRRRRRRSRHVWDLH